MWCRFVLCLWQLFSLVTDGFSKHVGNVKELTRWAHEIFLTFFADQAVRATSCFCSSTVHSHWHEYERMQVIVNRSLRSQRYKFCMNTTGYLLVAIVRAVSVWVLFFEQTALNTGLLQVLESPGIIFPDFQSLESPWICVWRSLKVLEFDFLKCRDRISYWIQWQLLMHLVNFSDNHIFWLMLGGVKLSNVNWTCLYMLIKVPVWVNLVLRIYPSYGPWRSLKSPWIWFWQMGKNHVNSINFFSL